MDFKESGLPQDHRIERCFNRIKTLFKKSYGPHAENYLTQIVERGRVLAEAAAHDKQPVPLICSLFLAFLDKDSYEHDNIRHDYGEDVFRTMKNVNSFKPLFSDPGFLSEVLQGPEIHRDARIIYLANAIAGLRGVKPVGDQVIHDDEIQGCVLIGNGCRGAHPVLEFLFDQELRKLNILEQDPDIVPPPTRHGHMPPPVLH